MKRVWARRTDKRASGRRKAHALACLLIRDTRTPIYLAPYAQPMAKGPPSCCRGLIRRQCRCILMRSAAMWRARLTLLFSWTGLVGIQPATSMFQGTSLSFCCRHAHQNSTRWKTSGNTCAKTGSPTVSLRTMMQSLMLDVTHGTIFSNNPKQSIQSECGIGRIQVSNNCRWYKLL